MSNWVQWHVGPRDEWDVDSWTVHAPSPHNTSDGRVRRTLCGNRIGKLAEGEWTDKPNDGEWSEHHYGVTCEECTEKLQEARNG